MFRALSLEVKGLILTLLLSRSDTTLKSTTNDSGTFRLKKLGHTSKGSDDSRITSNRTMATSPDDFPDLISPVEHVDWQPTPPPASRRRDAAPSTPSSDRRPSTPLREYFSTPTAPGDRPILAPERSSNPFLFRTHLNIPPLSFPSFSFLRRKNGRTSRDTHASSSSTRHITATSLPGELAPVHRIESATSTASFAMRDHSRTKISTCVWSEENDAAQQGQMSNVHPLKAYPEEPEPASRQDGVTVETKITQHAR